MSLRPILETRAAQPHTEGAGVKLHRAFGFQDPSELDPFLLFDDFRNENPEDYLRGFPWHPHRGIETITYVLAGHRGTWRFAGQRGHPGCRRCAVDDRRVGHPASGDALGQRQGPDARLPAVGQPACQPEDDRAALSGCEGHRHPRDHRR